MQIAEKSYVALDYYLTLDSGEEIDRSPEGQPLAFIVGSGQVIPGLEKKLIGRENGDSLEISVEPEEAYGLVNKDLLQEIPRDRFPQDIELEPGMTFQADGPRGPMPFTIHAITEDTVTADLNHPMAGQRLHFAITIVEVREASTVELASVNNACGCGCGGGDADKSQCGPGCGC